MQNPQVAIVMPAYNEAACIERVVQKWLGIADGHYGVLIVVNDGSRDETGTILDRLAAESSSLRVIHQKNAGHGAAVRRGYEEALKTGAQFVFQTDSDDQFEASDFESVWRLRERSPFVLGIRAERHDPLVRIVISRLNAVLLLVLFNVEIRDANIPFRLMRASFLAKQLAWLPAGVFAPNIFLSVLAKRSGVDVLEQPVTHKERKTGTVSILRWKLLKVCLRCAKELWNFRSYLSRNQSLLAKQLQAAAGDDTEAARHTA